MKPHGSALASLPAPPQPTELRRVLRYRDVVLLIVGTVIGSGIFLVPEVVLPDDGNSIPWAMSVWLVGGNFGRRWQATVDALLRAKEDGVPTFGVTDKTPIARFCDSFWIVSIANPSFHGSYVAPIAAIDALFVACAHIQTQRSLAVLQQKEDDSRSLVFACSG